MKNLVKSDALNKIEADALILPIWSEGDLPAATAQFDQAAGGLVKKLQESREVTGKPFETTLLYSPTGVAARIVLLVGLGSRDKFDAGQAYRTAATATKLLATKPRANLAFAWSDVLNADTTEAAVAGAMNGAVGQDLYRKEKKLTAWESCSWINGDAKAIERGTIVGESILLSRRLINEPPQDIYPESFANRAAELSKEHGINCEVWDQARLEKERCGSLLAVAKGSARAPRLIILKYSGADAKSPYLGLVGKGVTFDSGGLSLKTPDGMLTMKCDMSGAATVVATMCAIARLKLPVNVIAFAGLVENMTGSSAYKLGDVLHSRSGKTIEVHNTDAEGRLVLADVLDVAVSSGAAKLVDLATLTGSCMVALGRDVAGAMSNDDAWQEAVLKAAKTAGESLWPLPMFAEYTEHIQGAVADIKNVGDGRYGGAISAAKFLEEFVGGRPWVHLDIAGPAFAEKPKPWLDGGATGVYVRTLLELARSWK
jgi:leucyl aminopeptidase